MHTNYLKISLRSLVRNKVYVTINVLGLGLTLAICIVAYLNWEFSARFDRMHQKLDQIYRVYIERDLQGVKNDYAMSPLTLGKFVRDEFSEVREVVRFTPKTLAVKVDDKVFNKSIGFADPAFLEVFDFKLKKAVTPFSSGKSDIYLTGPMAEALFGEADPIGQRLSIIDENGREFPFMVAGVFDKMPENSSIRYDALVQFNNYLAIHKLDENNWQDFIGATFLLLNDPAKAESINAQLQKYVVLQNKAREDWIISTFKMEPLKEMAAQSRSRAGNYLWSAPPTSAVVGPPVIAFLLLLIAWFNFTNTSIAMSSKRLKEIGVRKVVGGSRKQLIIQFMLENLLLCFLALIVAVLIADVLVPVYSSMWEYIELELKLLENPFLLLFLLSILVVTAIAAGAYPAVYVSSFEPVKILKGSLKVNGAGLFSRVLLGVQFTICIIALVASVSFVQNAYFQERLEVGFEKENVLIIPVSNHQEYEKMRDALQSNVAFSSITWSEEHVGWGAYKHPVRVGDLQAEVAFMDVGTDYIQTMHMQLLQGRTFHPASEVAEQASAAIVNEKMVAQFGWKEPIGERIVLNDSVTLNVIGVVKNFYGAGLWRPIEPTIIRLADRKNTRQLVAAIPSGQLLEANKFAQAKWNEVIQIRPYEGFFQDKVMAEAKQVNKNIKDIFLALAVVATVLSSVGLFTLVSLNLISRNKEIGVRKVLGAETIQLFIMINRPFLVILCVASLLGGYLGYYLSHLLMSSIWAYHSTPNALTFIIPVTIAFVTALITVGRQTYATAQVNPVSLLRYE